MNKYLKVNNLLGWFCFLTAFIVYMLTLQPTVSFWDCGEFIAAAYKLQVGHQPGAPLFMIIGKLFSLIAAEPKQVAFWVNVGSALASAATIMFLYWSITFLAVKVIKKGSVLSSNQMTSVFGAGLVGAMAYMFSDSFWFSAVEAEVYALSSLSTAIVFWAVLKWELVADEAGADRWLVFIAYIIGLSVAIHLLSLLAVPVIVMVYYFRKNKQATKKGILMAFLVGCFLLAFIQYGIIQYLVLFASKFELFFVNSLKFGFGIGALTFVLLLVGVMAGGIIYSHKKRKAIFNLGLICISFILLGYSSYAMILIRANAKTNINLSNPDNAFSLLGYLGREQYGDRPLLFGQYFDSQYVAQHEDGKLYRKGKDQYEIMGNNTTLEYDRNTIFPRIFSNDASDVQYYRGWLGLSESQKPAFADNITFFNSYQVGFMYLRYFLWNFVGRQNDEQGQGNDTKGNWISGIKPLDALRFGNQYQLSPSITENKGYNRFYGLPLALGMIGLVFHIRKRRKDAGIVGLLFFFTGLAIVIYLNMDPLQVRERDYAYVGSFYAFAIWIGLGVLAIREGFSRFTPGPVSTAFSVVICFVSVPLIMGYEGWDDHNRSDQYTARDMAVNYLESCAPNAILFANADNDTYPLWYVQEVEGVRTDVRIVNLQLLNNSSYVDKLKERVNSSDPLPVTMLNEKYVQGVRDVMPFVDYGIADSVELSDVFEVLNSDNEGDKVSMQDGSKSNFLPTKKFHLTIDRKQLLKTGTIKPRELRKVASRMEWSFNRNYLIKSDLVIMDIITHNNWNRPVYFTDRISQDSYFGLDRYLYLEGYAYRLLPFQRDKNDDRDKSEVTNTDVLYSNIMNKFRLESFKKASYLDSESRRISSWTWDTMNLLASNLITEGKPAKAKQVLNKVLSTLPLQNYSITDTVDKYRTVTNLHRLKEISKANVIAKRAVEFLNKELQYYSSLDEKGQQKSVYEIRQIVSVLEAFRKEAEDHKQAEINTLIQNTYKSVEGKLMFSLQG